MADAATYTLSWTNPTQYNDGSPLPIVDLATIKIYCGTTPVLVATFPPVPATNILDLAGPEPNSCYATATTLAGVESTKSNTISLQIRPKPPTQFRRVPQ